MEEIALRVFARAGYVVHRDRGAFARFDFASLGSRLRDQMTAVRRCQPRTRMLR